MTKRLECIVDGCDAVCTGETEAEVMGIAEEHVNEAHPDVTLDEETVGAVRDAIVEV